MFTPEILEKIKKSKFLITGGAGFIGSNLVEKLIALEAAKIVIVDDLSTGFIENIQDFIPLPNVEFIQKSITDYEALLTAFNDIDIVIQLAALGSVPRSIDNPIATNAVNITGFLNVLAAAKENKVKKVVYASSSSVYGDDKTIPKIETSTGKPLSPYAVTKKANELYAETFADVYKMDIIGLRYFNVFGPKQNVKGAYAAVIPIFITNLTQNKPCSINGDGTISRDFTHVSNVVYANILAACATHFVKHEVFNIALGDKLSLNELYQTLEGEIKTGLSPIYLPKRIGDIDNSQADISKAKDLLHYAPVKTTNEGLIETINWYRSKSIMHA
ncbi:LPS biosynthesis protein WbpP [Putridiphycobacter roseus]|uniref:LPS biosynthesis protein WbpP n=1 Tax=Putridiphycobacter roseus TaxID=2219161 RepID=A0A2W1N4E6_9FLAO|nr:NAD-dependent epimerase/dehydratase family protein [Putridiphycobacter roseus]PZE18470.1 LPS biosynthesis protein WbpP [Putridiphycobacter roseus]